MKPLSTELQTHLQGEVLTLAHCWKITRRDATVLGFTSHDQDIVYDSVTYYSSPGFTPSDITSNAELAVDHLDVEAVLDSSFMTEADIMAGLYDFAQLEVFLLNYRDLTQGALNLRTGWIGEVTVGRGYFVAEVRGLMQSLSQHIGELYSPSCRAKLGDSRCQVNMSGYTVTGTVTSVSNQRVFADSSRSEASGYFDFGKITFTSGANAGLSMEVKEFLQGDAIRLMLPMPHAITIGDTYSLQAGCDKTLSTCASRFSNAVNFRGEPHVPGIDNMLQTVSTRT